MPGIIAPRKREAGPGSASAVPKLTFANLAIAAASGCTLGLLFVFITSSAYAGDYPAPTAGLVSGQSVKPQVLVAPAVAPPPPPPAAPVAPPPPPPAPKPKPARAPNAGSAVKTRACTASPLTRWGVRKVGDNDRMQIFLTEYPQLCLTSEGKTDVGYGSLADNVAIQVGVRPACPHLRAVQTPLRPSQPCSSGGSDRDLFSHTPAIDGSQGSVIQLVKSLRCLDVPGSPVRTDGCSCPRRYKSSHPACESRPPMESR